MNADSVVVKWFQGATYFLDATDRWEDYENAEKMPADEALARSAELTAHGTACGVVQHYGTPYEKVLTKEWP